MESVSGNLKMSSSSPNQIFTRAQLQTTRLYLEKPRLKTSFGKHR
ncbi:hypothetical protein LEMLEM_LOCUS22545 [Lemmus lemmus]